jgi:hypothetical protein
MGLRQKTINQPQTYISKNFDIALLGLLIYLLRDLFGHLTKQEKI